MGNSFTIHPPEGRDQVAAYFGGNLMSVDVTGDGRDDLFIASPLYVGETYDEGRVYVYISSGNDSVEEWVIHYIHFRRRVSEIRITLLLTVQGKQIVG